MPEASENVTRLLSRLRVGDAQAEGELFDLVFRELQSLAHGVFSSQRPGHTLQPTALVNEAWLKLAGNLDPVENRRHFFVLAGRAMRQVITDHARGRQRQKRGDGALQVTLDTRLAHAERGTLDLVELDDCLARLAERNERHAQVAELRLFSGLSIEETAETLGISPRSVDSDWAMAKAWLRKELS